MKTAIKCVKKGKCFPRRLSEIDTAAKKERERCGERALRGGGGTISGNTERKKGHRAAAKLGKGASPQSGVRSPKTYSEHFWVAGEQM